jgi:hypothetical protein
MKTFTTYATGRFVGMSEIAEILYEHAANFDEVLAKIAPIFE